MQKRDLFAWEMPQRGWTQSPLQNLPGKHKHSPWRPSRDNICIAQQSKVQPPAMACSHQNLSLQAEFLLFTGTYCSHVTNNTSIS